MEQRKMKIYEFSKGDIITRIESSKPYPNMYGENTPDTNFIGKAYEFIGIANGCLYIKNYVDKNKDDSSDDISFFKILYSSVAGKIINLNLNVWDEGWSYYIDPETMEIVSKNKDVNVEVSSYTKEQLEIKLNDALSEEDYEKAEELKKELKKFGL
jgi:hypothetical protein